MASDEEMNDWIAINLKVEPNSLRQWEYDFKATDDGDLKVIWIDEVPDFAEVEEENGEVFSIIDSYPYDDVEGEADEADPDVGISDDG